MESKIELKNHFFFKPQFIDYYRKALLHPESDYLPKLTYYILKNLPFLGGSYLEIGCGTGDLAYRVREYFSNLTLVDVSPAMLQVARKVFRGEGKVTFIEEEFSRFYEDNRRQYDTIVVVHAGAFCGERVFVDFLEETLTAEGKAIVSLLKPTPEKFFMDELYPLLFKKERKLPPHRYKIPQFLENLSKGRLNFSLYHVDYLLTQEFSNFSEALNFWKLHLSVEQMEYDTKVLEEFLAERLEKKDKGKYIYRNSVESVVVICEK